MQVSGQLTTDFLVIGSGLAGLASALKAAEAGREVILVTKRQLTECNTRYAQGGISCVTLADDHFDLHVEDTLKAGAGLCRRDAVAEIVADGPARMEDLIQWGIHFTRRGELENDLPADKAESYDLGREGGHSKRRILHSGDITGDELIRVLSEKCRQHERIHILEDTLAVDLITSTRLGYVGANICLGAYLLNVTNNQVLKVRAGVTILATGGAGKVYLYTTNPDVATGDGVAMAFRAGAGIANMEFFQFHPTCLYHPKEKTFLISEAVRGEGAELKVRRNGQMVAFMHEYHELGSLAPRDVVARAIDRELKKSGEKCVYLDITHHDREFIQKRFPTIFATCLRLGIDMSEQLIPVVPAAHYCCGGVKANVSGHTDVNLLYAVGEVANTGLHGANRLASNSLLEAVVMADKAVKSGLQELADCGESLDHVNIPDWHSGDAIDSDELVVITHNWEEIRKFMWDYVGIFRTDKRLERAKNRVRNIRHEIEQYYWNFKITADLIELRNLATVAELIIDSALRRKVSCGLHYNADCPVAQNDTELEDTVLRRINMKGIVEINK